MTIELLAPAKNIDIGKIAINCGADAVYIGALKFGARKEAANSVADIAELVTCAHRYLAKVYVALNTILQTDDEVLAAAALLKELYNAGVDGAIIQDMGLLEAGVPPMPIIASTQVHNASVQSVQFLEKVGFHRAILARELDIPDIASIARATTRIELEAFVHGALCVSYSGRCYLSAAAGGRSANRGECAQPCRKKYRLETQNGKPLAEGHLLSIKDLCRIEKLEALMDAGITSFKIEGRLKNAAYVANVVTAYRTALDQILNRREPNRPGDLTRQPVQSDLNKTFHRGYVSGFAKNNATMADFTTPKMTGEMLGHVSGIKGRRISLKTRKKIQLSGGDGICFLVGNQLQGTRVQKIEDQDLIVQDVTGIVKGTVLYRNRDHRFVSRLEKADTVREAPIHISMTYSETEQSLIAADQHGHTAHLRITEKFEPAENPEKMKQTLARQLAKSGDTVFAVADVAISVHTMPFVPVSKINELRRMLLNQLNDARAASLYRQRQQHAMTYHAGVHHQVPVDMYYNVSNSFAHRFYNQCHDAPVAPGVEAQKKYTTAKLMTSRYCLRRELGICLRKRDDQIPKAPLFLTDLNSPKRRLQLKFDCDACEMSLMYETATQSKD